MAESTLPFARNDCTTPSLFMITILIGLITILAGVIIWQRKCYATLKSKFAEYLGKIDKNLEKKFRSET